MSKQLRHIIVSAMLLFGALQAAAQIAMPDNVCVGTVRTYSVNDPSVPSTYTWKIDGVIQASTTNEFFKTWNTPGTFVLTVQEHTAGGCDGEIQSGEVHVNPAKTSLTKITVCSDPSYTWNGNTYTLTGIYDVPINDPLTGCDSIATLDLTFLSLTGPTVTVTDPTCTIPTGTVTITSTTSSAYTFSFDAAPYAAYPVGGYTGVAPGSHTLKAQVGSCTTPVTNFTVNAQPPPITAIGTTITNETCGLSNGTLNIDGVTGGTAPYTYSVDGSGFTSTINYTGLAAGNHDIIMKDANGCSFSGNVSIVNTAGPTVSVVAGTILCNGGTTALTATAGGGTAPYTYSIDGTTFQAGNTFTVGAGSYTVTVKDANGCTQPATAVPITEPSIITATTSTGTIACNGGTTTLTVTASGGTGALQYSLDGVTYQSGNTFTVNAGGSPYTVSIKDANGCIQTTTQAISEPAVLTASASPGTILCNGGTTILTATGVGGTAPYSYSTDGTTFQPGNTFTAGAGSYTVTIKDANGCTATAPAVTITEPVAITAIAITPTDATCGANNGTFNIDGVTGGTAPYTYSVDGSGFTSTTNYTGLAAGNHDIIMKDANGCSFSGNVSIVNTAGPTVIADAGTILCNGGTTTLTATANGGTAPYTYSIDGTTFQAGTTFTVGAGSYTVIVKDANGCTQPAPPVTITEPLIITATTSAGTIACNGGTTTLTVTASGGTGTLQYSLDGVTYQAANTFTVNAGGSPYTVSIKDANGCIQTTTQAISEPAVLTASASPGTILCNGGTTILTATGVGGTAPYSYSTDGTTFQPGNTFTVGAGSYTVTIKDANGCTATASAVTITEPAAIIDIITSVTDATCGALNGTLNVDAVTGGTAPYTYSVDGSGFTSTINYTGLGAGNHDIIVKDANGCSFSGNVSIINTAGPTASALAGTILCNGGTTTLTATASAGTAPYTYSIDGTTFQAGNTFTVGAGSYTVTVKDANGCTQPATAVPVTEPSIITATTSAGTIACNGGTTTLTVTASGGTGTLQYSLDGVTYQAGNTFTVNAGGSPYTVSIKDANGCIQTTTQAISEPAVLTASASPGTILCNGGTTILTATGVGGTAPYSYSTDGTTFQPGNTFTAGAGSYTVTIKDANGCTATATAVTITEPVAITAIAITPTDATCGANNGTFNIDGVTGGTAPYTYSVDGSGFTTTTNYTGLAAGTYDIIVKDANGCSFSGNVSIINTAGPTASALAGTILCNGGTTTLTATANGGTAPYTYSIDGTTFQAGNTFTVGAGSYTVIVKDANGCTQPAAPVTITEPLIITATTSAGTIACNGGTTTLTVTASGGTGTLQYSLDGVTYQAANTFTVNAGGSPYTVSIKDANGCIQTTTQAISEPAVLTASASPGTILCNGGTTILTATGVGGTAPYSYSTDGTTFQPGNTFTVGAGSYTVTIKDANGCTATATAVTITEPVAITAIAITPTDATCGANNGTFNIDGVTGGTAPYTYSVDGSGFTSTINYTGLAAGNHDIVVKDANGCSFSGNVSIVNTAGPTTVAASMTNAICEAANGTLNIGTVTGGVAPYTYAVDGGSYSATLIYSNLLAGTHSLSVKDNNGCTLTSSFIIGKNNVTITITSTNITNTVCTGSVGSIDISVTGGASPYIYAWTGPGGYTSSNQNISGLAAGTYSVTVTDVNGCTQNGTFTVALDNVTITVTANTIINTVCTGSVGSIDISVTGGASPYTYAWTGPGGYTSSNQNISGLAAGTYSITVTDVNGCTQNGTFTVALDNVTITVTANTIINTVCTGSVGSIDISVTGGASPYIYAWTGSGGYTSSNQNISGLAAGTYSVTVTDVNGCTQNGTFTVALDNVTIAVTANTIINTVCTGSVGSIDISVTGGASPYTYAWTGPGGYTSSNKNISGLAAGTYSVTVTDANGCTQSGSFTVAQDNVTIAIGSAVINTVCTGSNGSINLTISGGTAPYTYLWNNGATTEDISGLAAGIYSVTVKDANGCSQNGSYTVAQNNVTISIASTITNTVCTANNGTVDITITGGTAPYTYLWSNGATTEDIIGLGAGTYSVTVKDANGCSQNGSYIVGQNSITITIASTITNTICIANNGAVDITPGGGTGPYTYIWSNGATTQDISGLAAGAYTITLKDANGCTKNGSFTVAQVNSNIIITPSVTNTVCTANNGAININLSGGTAPFTYLWNNGATTQNISGLSAGNYSVKVTDANGCTKDGLFTVAQVISSITVTANVTKTVCSFNNGSIDISVSGGTSPYTYLWNNGSANSNISGLSAGTYSVTVTDVNGCEKSISALVETILPLADDPGSVTACGSYTLPALANGAYFDAPGAVGPIAAGTVISSSKTIYIYAETGTTPNCFVEHSFNITINPPPIPPFVIVSQPSCTIATGKVEVTVPVGPGISYSIDGSDYTNTSGIFNGIVPGSYSITAKNNVGCISLDRNVFINNPPQKTPDATVNVTQPVCGMLTGSITVTAPTGAGYTYSIDGTDYSNTTGIFTGVGEGTYNVTAKDGTSCPSPAVSATIIVPAGSIAPTVTLIQPTCTVPTGAISITTPTGAGLTYSIDGTDYNNTTGLFNGVAPGNYNVTVKNATGCISQPKAVTIDAQPPTPAKPTVAITQPTCLQVVGTLTVIAPTGAGLTYSIDGTTYTNTTGIFNNIAPGNYNITVKNATGCISQATSATMLMSTPAMPSATVTQPACTLSTGSITVTTPVGSGLTYSIDGTNYSNTNGIFTGLVPGSYSITVGNAGCVSPAFAVTVFAALPAPKFIVTDPAGECPPATVDITASAITAGSDAGLTYTYWTNATATTPLSNPGAVNASGTYYIKADGPTGCTQIAPVKVVMNQPPTIVLGGSGIICSGASSILSVALTGSAPFKFTYSDGSNDYTVGPITSTTYEFEVEPTVSTTYTIKSVSDAYCSNNGILTSAVITVFQAVQPVRYPTITALVGQPTQLNARNLGGNYTYSWNPPTGLDMPTIINPKFNYDRTTEYTITIATDAGCSIVDTLRVEVKPLTAAPPVPADIFVPNAFTPNGDGHNDVLAAFAVNIKTFKYFRVFNRWGQLVFETKEIGKGWDGMFNGKPQVIDAYVWTAEGISMDGTTIRRTGKSTLLR